MTAAATDGQEAVDLSLCFFPTQSGKNKAVTTEWELVAGEDENADLMQQFPAPARFVQCDCACK